MGSSVTWHVLGMRMGDQGGGGGRIRGATHLGAPCFLSCSLSCSLSRNLSSASLLRLLSSSNPSFAAESAWLGSREHSRDGKNWALTWALRSGQRWQRWQRYGGGWWWWKQERTRGNIWSHAARFGKHAPGGHKRPLLPVPINAIMAQSAKVL